MMLSLFEQNQKLQITLPAIGGPVLYLSLVVDSLIMSTSVQYIGTPGPVLSIGTLARNQTGYGAPSTKLYIDTPQSVPIIMSGLNLFPYYDSRFMTLYYGPIDQPLRYRCALVPIDTTETSLVCNTQADSQGLRNHFTIDVAGSWYTGSNIMDLPAFPVIRTISGCPILVANGTKTAGCPTEGGIRINVTGLNFATAFGATTVTVGNAPCTDVDVETERLLSCVLPVGTGQNRPVVVTSVGQVSRAANIVSYSLPSITALEGCAGNPPGPNNNASVIDCPREAQPRLTVTGANFGPSGAVALVGSDLCRDVVQDSDYPHRRLTCTIPTGTKTDLPVIVLQSGGISTGAARVAYRQCPTGKFARGLHCIDCSEGLYSDLLEAQKCTPCLPGTSTNVLTGSSFCFHCVPGKYSNAGASACTNCSAGYAVKTSGAAFCLPCPQGEYAAVNGSLECTACSPGKKQGAQGSIQCDPCEVGKAIDGFRRIGCAECTEGSATNRTGSITCSPCEFNTFQASKGAAVCTACPRGTSSSGESQTSCPLCPIGTYGDGSGTCTSCAAGRHAPDRGSTTCFLCLAGKFSPERAVDCITCGTNFFTPRAGAGSCTGCPPQSRSNELNTMCECPLGTYATSDDESIRCDECPSGAECDTTGLTAFTMLATDGFWRSDNQSLSYYQCLVSGHCVDGGCAANRAGPLCAVCADGYREDTTGQACSPCPSHSAAVGGSIGFTILIIAALLCVFYAMWIAESKHIRKNDPWKKVKPYTKEARVAPSWTYNFKLILGYFQVATSLLGLADIPWPTYFTRFIRYFDFVNFDFVPWGSVECVATLTFYDKLLLYAILPPCVLALLAAVPYTLLYVQDRMDFSDSPTWRIQRKLRRRKVMKLLVFALFLMYPTISARVLSFFVCRDINGTRYLAADFHLECNDSDWSRNVPLAIICLLVYPIGIPLVIFIILYRNRNRLLIPEVALAYGLLYEGYHARYYYFELADLVEKLLLTSILQFFVPGAQCLVGLAIIGVYMGVIWILGPYVRRIDDRLSLFIQAQLYLILLMGATLQRVEFIPESKEDVLGSTILLIVLFALVGLLLYHGTVFVRDWYRNYQRSRRLKKEEFLTANPMQAGGGSGAGGRRKGPKSKVAKAAAAADGEVVMNPLARTGSAVVRAGGNHRRSTGLVLAGERADDVYDRENDPFDGDETDFGEDRNDDDDDDGEDDLIDGDGSSRSGRSLGSGIESEDGTRSPRSMQSAADSGISSGGSGGGRGGIIANPLHQYNTMRLKPQAVKATYNMNNHNRMHDTTKAKSAPVDDTNGMFSMSALAQLARETVEAENDASTTPAVELTPVPPVPVVVAAAEPLAPPKSSYAVPLSRFPISIQQKVQSERAAAAASTAPTPPPVTAPPVPAPPPATIIDEDDLPPPPPEPAAELSDTAPAPAPTPAAIDEPPPPSAAGMLVRSLLLVRSSAHISSVVVVLSDVQKRRG